MVPVIGGDFIYKLIRCTKKILELADDLNSNVHPCKSTTHLIMAIPQKSAVFCKAFVMLVYREVQSECVGRLLILHW